MKHPAKKAAPAKPAHHVHHAPVKAGPAAPSQKAAGRRRHKAAARKQQHAKKAKKAKPVARKLARPGPGGWWILGGNDQLDCCAAVAVANSLLAVTGIRVTDADVAALFRLTGPASIEDTLRAVLHAGIGGHRPRSVSDVSICDMEAGLILGVDLEEPHAVTVAPGGRLITWGVTVPDLWPADEAWKVAW